MSVKKGWHALREASFHGRNVPDNTPRRALLMLMAVAGQGPARADLGFVHVGWRWR